MAQRSKLDTKILNLIDSQVIQVDIRRGVIFGKQLDLTGQRRRIGFVNSNGDHLFTFRDKNRSFQYYICRAIWIASNGIVPDKMIVVHKDGNQSNNQLDNLDTVVYSGKQITSKSWSEEELEWLKNNYSQKSLSHLAKECNRSIKAVRHKIKLINLPSKKGKNQKWTKKDNDLLAKLYGQKKSVKDIAKLLVRSESSIRLQASRKMGLFRSDRHLQTKFRSADFYHSLKSKISHRTAQAECCLCGYNRYIELHHIDGDNSNHDISNISSLCGNCHTEIEHGDHLGKKLSCIWWRVYSDGSLSKKQVTN